MKQLSWILFLITGGNIMRKSIASLVIFLTVLTFVVLGVIGILSNGDSLRLSLLAFVIGAIIYRHQLLRVLTKNFPLSRLIWMEGLLLQQT